ncbi:hypothetical protein FB45DRAFT_121203 [Roridomyces roridus]|uniref:Uncharacterized protein n=1 Tax=Roridomyces roridus TaxID=1738132 RepID=A0AAD7BID9_9AGAR|nr:hypothetical protein FB45DRAFT_121203 [Roridomyces roridus]
MSFFIQGISNLFTHRRKPSSTNTTPRTSLDSVSTQRSDHSVYSSSSIDSSATCSSWTSSSPLESPKSTFSISPTPTNKSRRRKIRDIPAKCVELITSTMPFREKDSSSNDSDNELRDPYSWPADPHAPLNPLDPTPRLTWRRNSLVLPPVPRSSTPDVCEWDQGEMYSPALKTPHRTTRKGPPPLHARAVKFRVPPPPKSGYCPRSRRSITGTSSGRAAFATPVDRGEDEEPVWSDFM